MFEELPEPVRHGKVLELDLHVKQVGDLSGALALLVDGKSYFSL